MTEYIYSILKSLSDFDFTVSEYVSDGGFKVTSSATQRYFKYVGCRSLEDIEIKEICRLLNLRYKNKLKDLIFSQIPLIPAGEQRFNIELDSSTLSIWINLQPDKLSLSIDGAESKRSEIVASEESFLNNTVIGPTASSAAKEAFIERLSQLLLKTL